MPNGWLAKAGGELSKLLILSMIMACRRTGALVAAALHSLLGYQSAPKAKRKQDNGPKLGKCDSDSDI